MTFPTEQPDAARGSEGPGGRPRVVVGVDGSPGSRAALVHALVAAARRDADVEVVSSYSVTLVYAGGAPLDVPEVAAIAEDLRSRVRTMVADVLDELEPSVAAGIRAHDLSLEVTREAAPQALLDRAEGAALLVVGSRGRGAMRSALLGSVALHCVTHAPCPVVVVHPSAPEARPSGRILVGVDGSDGSRAALEAAVDEAARTGDDVEAMVTYAIEDYWTDLASVVMPDAEAIRAELVQRTQRLVDDVLARRSGRPELPAPTVRISVGKGPAAELLVHHARSADLLVVGSRGRGAFRGLLLGSVALHCAMHAPCPVLVVHPQRGRHVAGAQDRTPAMADR